MDMDVPLDFQIMAGSTITRDLLDETGWSNQGKTCKSWQMFFGNPVALVITA